MPVKHAADGRILALSLPSGLDIAHRAAAALELQTLVVVYRPLGVRLHVPRGPASRASLSVLAGVRQLCEALGISLVLTDRPWHRSTVQAADPLPAGLSHGGAAS